MKIALIGYGKMGRLIEEIALRNGHSIVGRISKGKQISVETVGDADVCIDFSHPGCALGNIEQVAKLKKNLVMGTTGWYDHLDQVEEIVKKHQIGFLYAPNFSIGVNLFLNIVSQAAALINHFDEYDIGGFEAHHNQKVDSPSGTAKAIAETLLDKVERKKAVVYGGPERALAEHELHFSSQRCGHIPGTHSVFFDSPADSITLTHQARNREGFASGAVAAGEWLVGKQGFFTIQDLIRGG